MRATLALLGKDVREHLVTAIVLAVATLVVVLAALGQNGSTAFSMSPFEAVRFALLTYIPLVALIVGNRLVVREYLARTRLFVEALPVASLQPLLLKYLSGFGYLALLTLGLVLLAARAAGLADDVTADYVLWMFAKSLALVALYWSIVFCYSLCGHLRVVLYVLTLGLVALAAFWPVIDASSIPPFALLDSQLFVFEREVIPWFALLGTLAMAALFTVLGFTVGRMGEGRVADRLARPMTRGDHVALGMLLLGAGVGASFLMGDEERENFAFTSEYTAREASPPVAVFYGGERYRSLGDEFLTRTAESIAGLQAALGVSGVPVVRVALAPELDAHDVDYSTADGVLVRADWTSHDTYDLAVLDAVVLHGVLGILSGDRVMFEPYHWLLDGMSRWWSERQYQPQRKAHEAELVARAVHVQQRAGEPLDLIDDWQIIADRFAYPSAEALAWSAFRYLEIEKGEETVLALARAFFVVPVGGNSLDAFSDRRSGTRVRFTRATGIEWDDFVTGWQTWLDGRARSPATRELLAAIPPIRASFAAGADDRGVYRLLGGYLPLDAAALDGDVASSASFASSASSDLSALTCVLKHDVLGPFDNEFDVDQGRDPRTRDEASCALVSATADAAVHDVSSRYAPGERVYIAFDLEDSVFHQPLRLDARRITLPDRSLESDDGGDAFAVTPSGQRG